MELQTASVKQKSTHTDDFVLEKSIFNNIFEKDIRRVFIYKKAERLAKALHLITPAFVGSPSLKDRVELIAIALVDAAVLPPSVARLNLSRELLALSSVLAISRTGGLLSSMNADLISREAHALLQEVAGYEEPRLFFDDAPTLADIARKVPKHDMPHARPDENRAVPKTAPRRALLVKKHNSTSQGHIKDRRESVLSVIREKGSVSIKDISTLIRGVSEKTIQRELSSLVESGVVKKTGERRWSVYSLAS